MIPFSAKNGPCAVKISCYKVPVISQPIFDVYSMGRPQAKQFQILIDVI